MRIPTHSMAGNLRWTRSGVVWADWILTGIPYGLRPTKHKKVARAMHAALVRGLPGESLLLGLSAGLDPAAIVERMLDGVDLDACPAWVREATATLDTLDQIGPGQRIYWLSVPLANSRPLDKVVAPFRAAHADLRDQVGLPRAGIPTDEVLRRLAQAEQVAKAIPSSFHAKPATPAQMLWLELHSQQRGLYRDLDLPSSTTARADEASPVRAQAVGEPDLDECAKSDLGSRDARNPLITLKRKVVKVTRPDEVEEPPASYQSLLVLSDMPSNGLVFPGSEFLGRIDESGLDVDWAVRLTVRASDEVRAANKRALVNINEQFNQREGEISPTGVGVLERAASDLAEYVAALESDKDEVEAQATFIFAVAATTAENAIDQAKALAAHLSPSGHKLVQPTGYQQEMWWAMQPGVPAGRVVREFTQLTTSVNLAGAVPLASNAVGDRKGSVVGLNITNGPLLDINVPCGPTSVIMHDLEGAAVEGRDISGSFAVSGDLGSGKSSYLKSTAGAVVDRGGRVLAVDRTKMGEYAVWARSVTACTVVDPDAPVVSMCPLRVLGLELGAGLAKTFLTRLLDVGPTSRRGVVLSAVLEPSYLREQEIRGLGDLKDHLATGPAPFGEVAEDLARTMDVFATERFGRVIFDETLPALSVDARAIVIRTHTLTLPSERELTHEHLFRQMGAEKIFGRAFYALIAAFVRAIGFARSELFLFITDEFHGFNSSPEALDEVATVVRDGRKHNAAVGMGSHDAEEDFGNEVMRGLVPMRILMRHRDPTLAARGISWLGLEPTEDLVDLITKDTAPEDPVDGKVPEYRRGECLVRDASGNIGRCKILLPSDPTRNEAVRSSAPPSQSALAGAAS